MLSKCFWMNKQTMSGFLDMSKMFSCKESMEVVKSELKKKNVQRMAVYESKLLCGDNVTQNC